MIDREALVKRHNPVLKEPIFESPLSIGNGEFSFTADITGLQTFPEFYSEGMPLCIQSQWGWHTIPVENEENYSRSDLRLKYYDTYGRQVGYAKDEEGQEDIYNWLRENPHRLHLGQIGLYLEKSNQHIVKIKDIKEIKQTLDMWEGIITSTYLFEGIPVTVKTVCHPERDLISVAIKSPLIKQQRLAIDFRFPYGSGKKTAANWDNIKGHKTRLYNNRGNCYDFVRILDKDYYFCRLDFSAGKLARKSSHHYRLYPAAEKGELTFSFEFSPQTIRQDLPVYKYVVKSSKKYWSKFWINGGVIDLSASNDNRAEELERRIVLSQYLTAIQCAGSMPPQETGLTCNSWYGKFHLEMHFWHSAHFPVWGRAELLQKSLWWYQFILDEAKELAYSQGYKGARWPKMVGPDGIDSPSPIAPLLIWQQPHPIIYAELCYRASCDLSILDNFQEIVFETADFMADYAYFDEDNDRFVLGPPLIPAQENHLPEMTINPTFELEYWINGLNIAREWRKRLGLKANPIWDSVVAKLSKLPEKDGLYLAHENCLSTFEDYNYDHPSMLAALGVLPGKLVNNEVMKNTLKRVLKDWQLERSWGWDFPVIAMAATRLGLPEIAVDSLLMDSPKNIYLPNGHNYQRTRNDLPLYLPGNGGLLLATALMTAGWEGYMGNIPPGFPDNNSWTVKWEGINSWF